jgi:lysylphosphatidylglycerol synthetase-like protein (DUF2156 family)
LGVGWTDRGPNYATVARRGPDRLGPAAVTRRAMPVQGGEAQPAFYAHIGSPWGDLFSLLHPPYTAWHLSYVVYGAAVASEFDLLHLAGALVAFLFGTGIAAHALDELHGHPMGTQFGDSVLLTLGVGGLMASLVVAVLGALVISPWTLAWATAGAFLAMGYTLEWHHLLHTDLTFGLAWGAFPVLVGYWAQTEQLSIAAILIALAATLLSLAQRALSKSARYVRRNALAASLQAETDVGVEQWPRDRLLATWEWPLRLLSAATVTLAVGLIVSRT